jgi:hypothetical protein
MRAASVMRIVIFGAVGFGIGLAIAGFFNSVFIAITAPMFPPGRGAEPPPWWMSQLPYLSWFLAGACGGAGLGLALKSWKKVAALALAGCVGFGVGHFFFVLAFLFGFPLVGAGVGALGGLMLGLALADWRKVLLLGLAGMVGFGIGGAIAAAMGMPTGLPFEWEQPTLLLMLYVLVQGMVGLFGGATLGTALGYLENRTRAQEPRPRVR